jgi:spore maturation protein SpmA
MLNYLWAGMIAIGIIYAVFSGNMEAVTNGALDSSKEAISLCLSMCGVMALWMGLMEIAQTSGLMEQMTKRIAPFVNFLFPKIPKNHPAREAISTNIIANVLGLSSVNQVMTVHSLCNYIRYLNEAMGIPSHLSEILTISREEYESHLDAMADAAIDDSCTATNPRVPLKPEVIDIYRKLW